MNLNDFFNSFPLFSGVFWARVFLLTFTFFYCILALVTLRQTQLMARILDEVDFSPFLKILAVIHFILATGVFILALVLLVF